MRVLEVKNLTKMYTKTSGIKDISFNLEEKECLAIIGKSGSGKSTLIKTLLNLIDKNSGSVKFYNTTLDNNYEDIIRVIGYLPDKIPEFKKEKISSLIKQIKNYYDIDYTKDIDDYLNLFKLDKEAYIDKLSSGELQKLRLILALFHKPKILILDEPTNFLDTTSIHILSQILKNLKYEGTSIIIASHSLSFLLSLADNIYLIKDNTLIDTKDKLKDNKYKKINIKTPREITYKDLNIKGISQIKLANYSASFIYQDDIAYLIKKLNALDVLDITIEDPNVDDIYGGLINDL